MTKGVLEVEVQVAVRLLLCNISPSFNRRFLVCASINVFFNLYFSVLCVHLCKILEIKVDLTLGRTALLDMCYDGGCRSPQMIFLHTAETWQ